MFGRWFGRGGDGSYALGLESLRCGELRDAIAHFDHVLEDDPSGKSADGELAAFYRGEAFARLGRQALSDGRDVDAIESLHEAIAAAPTYPDLHYCLGLAQLRQGDAMGADASARHALDRNAQYLEAQMLRYLAQMESGESSRAAITLSQGRELAASKSSALAQLLRGEDPREEDLWPLLLGDPSRRERIERAKALFEQGFWQASRDALSELVSETPRYPDLRFLLAKSCYRLGDEEFASRELDAALELHPTFQEALLLRGVLELRSQHVSAALHHFQAGVAAVGDTSFARFGLAVAQLLLDDVAGASAEAERLGRSDYNSAAVLRLLAFTRAKAGDSRASVRACEGWLHAGELEAHELVDCVVLALAAGDVPLARQAVDRLPAGAPSADVAMARSRVLGELGEWRASLDVLVAAFAEHPDSGALAVDLASRYVQLGDSAAAIQLLRDFASPALDVAVPIALARALRNVGEVREAMELLASVDADLPQRQLELLFCYRQAGESDAAIAAESALRRAQPLSLEARTQNSLDWCAPFEFHSSAAAALDTAQLAK